MPQASIKSWNLSSKSMADWLATLAGKVKHYEAECGISVSKIHVLRLTSRDLFQQFMRLAPVRKRLRTNSQQCADQK